MSSTYCLVIPHQGMPYVVRQKEMTHDQHMKANMVININKMEVTKNRWGPNGPVGVVGDSDLPRWTVSNLMRRKGAPWMF